MIDRSRVYAFYTSRSCDVINMKFGFQSDERIHGLLIGENGNL